MKSNKPFEINCDLLEFYCTLNSKLYVREYIPSIRHFKHMDIKQYNILPFCSSPRAEAALQFLLVSGDLSKPISHGLASSVANYDANWRGIHSGHLKEG